MLQVIPPEQVEIVDDFSPFGVHAFTTTRAAGSFSTGSDEPVRDVMGRWDALRATAASRGVRRLATAWQVHGAHVLVHDPGWEGWLRGAPMTSPDIRAGMAMLLAAACAEGTSTINNADQIERGYERIEERLNALGARITRVPERGR